MSANREYDELWERWLRNPEIESHIRAHLEHRAPFLGLLQRHARPGDRTLEVGCGFAIDSAWLAGQSETVPFGIDLSPAAVRAATLACRGLGRVPALAVADAARLPFADRSFRLVFSQGVLEHFADPAPALAEQARVLEAGGLLLVNVPQKYNPYTIYKRRRLKEGTWEYGWETEYSLKGLRDLGRPLGLKVVDRLGYGYERGRDYGLYEVRHVTRRMEHTRKYPFLNRLGAAGERVVRRIEDRFGHHFCQNIAVVFAYEGSP